MNYIWKFVPNFKEFYGEINSATLTGAIDVIVVQQDDGTYSCSPFHVRFGKIGVLRSREKVVDIEINGQPIDIHMKLGETGEAFFVEETDEETNVPSYLATSPIPVVPDIKKALELLKRGFAEQDVQCDVVEVITPNYSANPPRNIEASFELSSKELPNSTEVAAKNECLEHVEEIELPFETATACPCDDASLETEPTLAAGSQIGDGAANEVDSTEGFAADAAKTVKIEPSDNKNVLNENTSFIPIQTAGAGSLQGYSTENSVLSTENSHTESTGNEIADKSDEDKSKIRNRRKRKSKKRANKAKEIVLEVKGSASTEVASLSENAYRDQAFSKPDVDLEPSVPSTTITLATPQIRPLEMTESQEWRYDDLDITAGFHPYSEGEITPCGSPSGSRPSTPKSDTEYEIKKMEAASQTETDQHHWSWTWGELPVPPKLPNESREDPSSDDDSSAKAKQIKKDHEQQRSRFGGVLQFMGMSKGNLPKQECEGLYLEDLNVKDPEMAARYFSRNSTWSNMSQMRDGSAKDEDAESGNGSSLPQSPHSVKGAIGGPTSSADSDSDERTALSSFNHGDIDIAFSLCGNLSQYDYDIPHERFTKLQVTYENFCNNPSLINNPDLVVRINRKYYNWQTAAPILMSFVAFQRPLPDNIVNNLIKNHMPKKQKKSEGKAYSWFTWRRSTVPETDNQKNEKKLAEEKKSKSVVVEMSTTDLTSHSAPVSIPSAHDETVLDFKSQSEEDFMKMSKDDEELQREEQYPPPTDGEKQFKTISTENDFEPERFAEKFRKTLRLTSEQIAKLNLSPGPNEVVFSVTTAYQGTTRCKCHIYLWRYDDQIVISDIDGTITKSDVLGHILPIIGKSWAQAGVAHLFTKINNNGYQFLYLSARAIGQAHTTREYLRSVRQGDVTLPDGPLLLSPSSLMSALHREVIEKKPEEFKISCLRDILALFPSRKPFSAGYGNRINDVWAYRAVGIPMHKIFTINHKGELKHEQHSNYQSSYINMSNVVDHFFPPLRRSMSTSGTLSTDFFGAEEFSSYTFWRTPIPDVVVDLEILEKPTSKVENSKGEKK